MKFFRALTPLFLLPLPASASVVALFDFEDDSDANKASLTGIATGSSISGGTAFNTDNGFSNESPNGGLRSRFARGTAVQQISGSTGVAFPQAILDGNYVEFTVSTDLGFTMSLERFTLDAGWQGQESGRFGVTSSINGHDYSSLETITTEIAEDAGSIPNVLQSNLAGSWAKLSLGDWGSGEGTTIDVSGAEFQNINSVTFRLYGFAINDAGPANTANIYRLDNIQLEASVAVPEPSTMLLGFLGVFGVFCRRR
ncbi:PEP-CTERM sorting domain-containing protein (plasmid) [Verrucomicrobiaceae bacterium 227]